MLRRRFDEWITTHTADSDQEVARLARHLAKYQDEFLYYLEDPSVSATNNLAEQTLRFAVLLRKVGCGNRTWAGARTFETLSSILATYRRSGIDFAGWVSDQMQWDRPKLVPASLLPAGCTASIQY